VGLAAKLPRSSIRILVCDHLTARYRTGINGRGNDQCSWHRVTPLRRVSVPISVAIGGSISVSVSVSVLGSVRLGGVCASPRTVRMSGLSVGILWSYFAMLQKQSGVSLYLVTDPVMGGTVPRSLRLQR